eukprot:1191208-Prorocentrum_minimum.AAC.8
MGLLVAIPGGKAPTEGLYDLAADVLALDPRHLLELQRGEVGGAVATGPPARRPNSDAGGPVPTTPKRDMSSVGGPVPTRPKRDMASAGGPVPTGPRRDMSE